jgi:hypothetical protein
MPKKLKLGLSPLKVQSFVTSLTGKDKKGIRAGGTTDLTSLQVACSCGGSCDTCEPCEPSVPCPSLESCVETCHETECCQSDVCTITVCTFDPKICKTFGLPACPDNSPR